MGVSGGVSGVVSGVVSDVVSTPTKTQCDSGFYGYPDCKKGIRFMHTFIYTWICTNFNLALDCACDIMGSTSTECNENGACSCKTNIDGNKCTKCKPFTYGNFPDCESKFLVWFLDYLSLLRNCKYVIMP